jgi:glucosamine--fructose-6-phosphate aminotransferase (isomerizing)
MSKMLEEIRQQPETLEATLRLEMRRIEKFRALVSRRKPRLIVLVARGTSDNAAQFGRYLIEITTGIPVALAAPSVSTLYGVRLDLRETMVIAISQSGESTDTNLVLEQARKQNAITVGVTNESRSSLAKLAEHVFLVRAGKEKSVAATKTYTGQLMMMYLIAYALGAKIRVSELERIADAVQLAIGLEGEIAALSERYRFMDHAVVMARGLNYANAFEFALKMMETCYVIAERFSSADFQHGPIAMIEHGFPAFLFAPAGVTWPGMKEMCLKLKALNAEMIFITDRRNPEACEMGTRLICLPEKLPEILTPIPYIVPAQLFAAALAGHKGIDPDKPRTLNKVTKTI